MDATAKMGFSWTVKEDVSVQGTVMFALLVNMLTDVDHMHVVHAQIKTEIVLGSSAVVDVFAILGYFVIIAANV
jgi:hypothetical protein